MGTADSKHVNSLPQPKGDSFIMYCCQHFGGKILLLNASNQVARIIHQAIVNEWSGKCELITKAPYVQKLKFSSSPFNYILQKTNIKSHHLFCQINEDLARYGWTLLSAPQFVHDNGLSAWIYSQESDISEKLTGDHCAVNISSWSDLQFVDFPPGLPSELSSHISHVYRDILSKKEDENQILELNNSNVGNLEEILPRQFSLSLSGRPWIATGKNSLLARNLLLDIVIFMHLRGYKLQASTLLKEDTSDCLFFAKLPFPPDQVNNSHILLALKADDYIAVLGTNDEILSRLRTFFRTHWKDGLKDLTEKHGYPVIALNGSPWPAKGRREIEVKTMLIKVFEDMSDIGYQPIESIDSSQRMEDKSAILFMKKGECRMRFLCLSVSVESDKLCIINATPEELDLIRQEIHRSYTPGIDREDKFGEAWRIKFNCNPISGNDTNGTICLQSAILSILHELKGHGFKLMFSADVSKHLVYRKQTETVEPLSAHSLFLAKPVSHVADCQSIDKMPGQAFGFQFTQSLNNIYS